MVLSLWEIVDLHRGRRIVAARRVYPPVRAISIRDFSRFFRFSTGATCIFRTHARRGARRYRGKRFPFDLPPCNVYIRLFSLYTRRRFRSSVVCVYTIGHRVHEGAALTTGNRFLAIHRRNEGFDVSHCFFPSYLYVQTVSVSRRHEYTILYRNVIQRATITANNDRIVTAAVWKLRWGILRCIM